MTVLLAAALYLAALGLLQAAARRWRLNPEHTRTAAHIACGLTAAALPLELSRPQIVASGLALALVMALSQRLHLLACIHGVARTTCGEVLFPLACAVTAWIAPEPGTYSQAILVLALADPAANLAGRAAGGPRLPLSAGGKTVAGSSAFLAVATLVTTLFLATRMAPGPALLLGSAIALAACIAEAISRRGADNLVVPVVVAGLCALL